MRHKVSITDIGAYILLIVLAGYVYFSWDTNPAGCPVTEITSN